MSARTRLRSLVPHALNRAPVLAAVLALCASSSAQDATLSLVSGLQPGDLFHLGVSTPDPALDRCRIFVSEGPSAPFLFHGVTIVVARDRALAATARLQACRPPVASDMVFGLDGAILTSIAPGAELHLQAVLWSSAEPAHRTISNGIVADIRPSGDPLVRWTADVYSSTQIALRQLNVDTLQRTMDRLVTTPPAIGSTSPLTIAGLGKPVVSGSDDSVAIPVSLTDATVGGDVARVALYVLRNVRSTNPNLVTGYWLPLVDPGLTLASYHIAGAPQFHPVRTDEVWVVEVRRWESGCFIPPSTVLTPHLHRLAKYRLGSGSAQFLSAIDLQDPAQPCNGRMSLAFENWTIDPRMDQAIFVKQIDQGGAGSGLVLARYGFGGSSSSSALSSDGFTYYTAGFPGLVRVPGTPWAMVQYGRGTGFTSYLRFVDLDSGALSDELAVGSRAGRISDDGTLALFQQAGMGSTAALPIAIGPPVRGQAPRALALIPGYFCTSVGSLSDTVAADGSDLVTADDCNLPVHRLRLGALGELEQADVCPTTGFGTAFTFHSAMRAFNAPGRNALYDLTEGDRLVMLDVTTLSYGAASVSIPGRYFF